MLDLDGQDGHQIIGLDRQQFDLTEPEEFDRIVDKIEPDAIMNAAAYTAVDRAEDEPGLAHQINAVAPGIMASVAAKNGLPFIHISTDYVFDGCKGEPYNEQDETGPINAYGETKLSGEIGVLTGHVSATVLRVSGVFSPYGSNFVKTISRALTEKKLIRVVNDQLSCPTAADSVARACLLSLAGSPMPGVYHFSGTQGMSWFEFARLIEKQLGMRRASKIEPCRSDSYPTKAPRPANTILENAKIAGELDLPCMALSVQVSHALGLREATTRV